MLVLLKHLFGKDFKILPLSELFWCRWWIFLDHLNCLRLNVECPLVGFPEPLVDLMLSHIDIFCHGHPLFLRRTFSIHLFVYALQVLDLLLVSLDTTIHWVQSLEPWFNIFQVGHPLLSIYFWFIYLCYRYLGCLFCLLQDLAVLFIEPFTSNLSSLYDIRFLILNRWAKRFF